MEREREEEGGWRREREWRGRRMEREREWRGRRMEKRESGEDGEEREWRGRRMEEDGEEEESTIRSVYSVQTKSESSAYVYKAGVDIICSFHSSWP